jgi:acyl-CoA hydrolase
MELIGTSATPLNWQEDYKQKLTSAEQALKAVRSGDQLYVHSNAAAPQALIQALVNRAGELRDVGIFHLLTLGKADYVQPAYSDNFRVHALFIGPNVRQAVNEGRADYTPVFLSEIPELFSSGTLPVDVCLIQISPPDAHGYCSLGVSVDCTLAARKAARIVIAQVNKFMPRTLGRSFIHVSRLHHIVEQDEPLLELFYSDPDETELAIGRHVASLIEDEATLQMGIGAIPNAVLKYLGDRRELGIHTEMFSDGILDLVRRGVITNSAKTVLPGKVAVSFLMGSKRLYEFVHDNPLIEMQPSDFINDPMIVAQNYKMTAINSAIQVDVTGQVSADSIGKSLYSGFGGQVDFIRGAARSKGGKAIIAMPSTAKSGQISRIVTFLDQGSGVVTSRADVHYVVTEYGIADLHGKNLRARAKSLIDIAHPKFRDELRHQCANLSWL